MIVKQVELFTGDLKSKKLCLFLFQYLFLFYQHRHTVNLTARSLTPVTVTKIINITVPVTTGENSVVTTAMSLSETEETSESATVTTVGASDVSTSEPSLTTDTDQAGITLSTVILTDESPAEMAATTIRVPTRKSVLATSTKNPSTEIAVTEENVTETVMYPIEETICVTLYNEEPITGLRLDHGNNFYDIVNDTTKLTASVATGTALTAQWVFEDKVYIQQVLFFRFKIRIPKVIPTSGMCRCTLSSEKAYIQEAHTLTNIQTCTHNHFSAVHSRT